MLQFAPQAASEPVGKVLQSAIANARVKADSGVRAVRRARAASSSAAYVDEGPTLKRFRPRAQGRAYRIRKRTSHITVVVDAAAPTAAAPAAQEGEDPLVGQKVNPHGFRLGITTEHKQPLVRRQHQGRSALPRLRQGGRRDPHA